MNRKIVLFVLIILGVSSIVAWYRFPTAKAIIWIEGHITSDTTWTPVDTYRVINNTYVDPGVTLTMLPGVHVQFADGFSLFIDGSLNATGTEIDPIEFTSSRATPSPGVWNTIRFRGSLSDSFSLENVKVEYAVDGIRIDSLGNVHVKGSNFSNNSEAGILVVKGSYLAVEENKFSSNQYGVLAQDLSGIIANGNSFTHNYKDGISWEKNNLENATISENLFLWNGERGLSFSGWNIRNLTLTKNAISFNAGHGINVYSSRVGDSPNPIDTYLANVTISANEIEMNGGDGVNLRSQSGYYIYGPANTSLCNITIQDNNIISNGGDAVDLFSDGNYGYGHGGHSYLSNVRILNNTAYSNGFYLQSNAHTTWDIYGSYVANITIEDNFVQSGDGFRLSSKGSPAYLDTIKVSRNRIFSCYSGLTMTSETFVSEITISQNTISSCTANAVSVNGNHEENIDVSVVDNKLSSCHRGILVSGSCVSNVTGNSIGFNSYGIEYSISQNNMAGFNDIYGNDYGMNVIGGATVNAEYNYWGDSTGPYQPSLNPEGKGNPVNGNGVDLDFIPFLTSPQGYINQRPVAALSVDKKTVGVNETVTFDATNSTDDGRIDYYFFDFGDGTNSSWTPLPAVTHKYASNGTFYATVTVMDDYGVTSTNAQLIRVQIIVVPEFPSFLILPLFMIVTLIAVAFQRRKCVTVRRYLNRTEEFGRYRP